jgi:cobyric acid synthase
MAENMSNNAAVTADGGEIARSIAVQAAAAGIEPDVRMNPILSKAVAIMTAHVGLLHPRHLTMHSGAAGSAGSAGMIMVS